LQEKIAHYEIENISGLARIAEEQVSRGGGTHGLWNGVLE
jgi:hypothetical protein